MSALGITREWKDFIRESEDLLSAKEIDFKGSIGGWECGVTMLKEAMEILGSTEQRFAESHREYLEIGERFEELGRALKEERDAKDRPTLGACFDRLFEEARACENLLTWTGWEGSHNQWEVTVRRVDGKTLDQILADRAATINGLTNRFETIFAAHHENYESDEAFIKLVLENCEEVLDA